MYYYYYVLLLLCIIIIMYYYYVLLCIIMYYYYYYVLLLLLCIIIMYYYYYVLLCIIIIMYYYVLLCSIKQLLNEVEHDIENYQGRGCVIHRSRRLTHTEALIILDIMRKPSSIIVLLCIQNQKTKNNTNETHENFMQNFKLIVPAFFLMFSRCSNVFKTIK